MENKGKKTDPELWKIKEKDPELWKIKETDPELWKTVLEIILGTLVDIQSTNELIFGGPALILVDQKKYMQ